MREPSTASYDVNYVHHEHKGWIAVWFSTNHGKFELLRNALPRAFAGAKYSPQYRAWYLGPGATLAQLHALCTRLGATAVRRELDAMKARAGEMTDEAVAKQLYGIWKSGVEAAREFDSVGDANMECFQGWGKLPYKDDSEPVDQVHFLRVAREIRNGISVSWKAGHKGRAGSRGPHSHDK